tara:strand:- start:7328 stop:9388 length:2061 start_codon:yes stop_codon:yes gene_type:complete
MGGFTSGFNPKIFDFAGHRLRKQELRLKERQLNLKEGKQGDQMRQSAVRESKIDPKFAEKFLPGQEELLRQLDQYAATYANELNHKNTATDDIEGQFDPDIYSVYRNMERQIMLFAEHSVQYVNEYKSQHGKVRELDVNGNPVYNLDVLEQDPVYLTKEMVERNMGDNENMDDYSWMWNAGGTAHDDGAGQQTALKENGEYKYMDGPGGEKFLLGEDGNRLIAYELDANNKVVQSQSGKYAFETRFNEEYNPLFTKFDAKGNIVYGESGSEIAFYDYWSKEFDILDKKKYSTNGIDEISNGLKFNILYDETGSGANGYLTSEAMNGLWNQAERASMWDRSMADGKGSWSNNFAEFASRQAAEQLLIDLNGVQPSPEAITEAQRKIKLGILRGDDDELLGELPEDLKKSSAHAPGKQLETYQDYMTEMILDHWKSRHASIDIRKPQGIVNKETLFDNPNASSTETVIELSGGGTAVNTIAFEHAVSKDLTNLDRPWKPISMDGDNVAEINNSTDVAFQSFDPIMTGILQRGAAQGTINAGKTGFRVIDKRTGKLMNNVKFDKSKNSFMFADAESAQNGIVVFGFDGYWKAKNPNQVRALISGDTEGNLNNEDKVYLNKILDNEDGIEGFFPINQNLLSVGELKLYKEQIEFGETIKKVYIENGERKEFAFMSDDINDGWNGFPGSNA